MVWRPDFARESFGAIAVAAGAATASPELLVALKVGGRLVMPLGRPWMTSIWR